MVQIGKWMKRNSANILTSVRIFGAVILLFIEPFSSAFFVLYTVCGITDAFDGWVARRFNNESLFGAKLDSVADLLFYSSALIKIIPSFFGILPMPIWIFTAVILFIRLVSYLTALIKFHRFPSLHTYGNKLTGVILFFLPYLIYSKRIIEICAFICIIAGISSTEELFIHIISSEYDPNRKTIIGCVGKKQSGSSKMQDRDTPQS